MDDLATGRESQPSGPGNGVSVRTDRSPQSAGRKPRREACRGGREEVSPVEGGSDPRKGVEPGRFDPKGSSQAEGVREGHEHAVVRPHQRRTVGAFGTSRHLLPAPISQRVLAICAAMNGEQKCPRRNFPARR